MLLVTANNAAMNTSVQVSVDLFSVVSEKLTFVEWKEVAERWIRASIILALFAGGSGLPVARLSPGDHQGVTKVGGPQLVKEGPKNL